MSRGRWSRTRGTACFPRVSGDEPALALDEEYTISFSPRERG